MIKLLEDGSILKKKLRMKLFIMSNTLLEGINNIKKHAEATRMFNDQVKGTSSTERLNRNLSYAAII